MRATAAKVRYYHLTSDRDFTLDPEYTPAGYQGYVHQPSLFVTPNPELWIRLWEPRAWAAEIDVSRLGPGEFQDASMFDRDQFLIPAKAFDKVKVTRVVSTTEAIRDAKRAGYGFAFMRPSERGRLCIAKSFGSLEALCGRMLSDSDVMEKWTTIKWAKEFPQTCPECKAKLGKTAKVARTAARDLAEAIDWWTGDISMTITDAAVALAGTPSGWSTGFHNDEAKAAARLLIEAAEPVSGPLYHGTGGQREHRVGETFTIPLMATSRRMDHAEEWANPGADPQWPGSVYVFDKAYGVVAHSNEVIVSGRYRVTKIEDERIVHLTASAPLRVQGARGRGLDFKDMWSAYEPMLWVIGKLGGEAGHWGEWRGYFTLSQQKMSYEDALRPVVLVHELVEKAKANRLVKDLDIVSLHLVAEGRTRSGNTEQWHVAQMPIDGTVFGPPKGRIEGTHREAEPNVRLMNAMMYSEGEEARKWIGENLAGVVVDDSMFDHLQEGQRVTVYRGLSLHPSQDPLTSAKGDGWDLGNSWTTDLTAAKAIAERGMAGFNSAQTLGDVYRIFPEKEWHGQRNPDNYVPTVLRAEVTLTAPEAGGPAPYRPWTIDYASEAEIDLPRGTKVTIDGVLQAKKRVRQKGVDNPGEQYIERVWEEVTWTWPSSWKRVNVQRTAGQWITDDEGEQRWGTRGAAGVLFKHTDDEGVTRYLLDKRVHWVDHGGTWGIPGGALDEGEGVIDGALREVEEEFGFLPKHRIRGTHVKRVGDWSYTTVVAEVDEMFTTGRTHESQGSQWFTVEEMTNLHPDLAKAMPALTKITALSLESVISVAEHAMERGGLAGKTIEVPVGHMEDPDYRAAIKPLESYCSKVVGHSMFRKVYSNEYTLQQAGYPQGMVTPMGSIVLRPVTTEMTILHECAHILTRTSEAGGHTMAFAETARDLYAQYLSQEAADVFWRLVHDLRTEGSAGGLRVYRGIRVGWMDEDEATNLDADDLRRIVARIREPMGVHWSERWSIAAQHAAGTHPLGHYDSERHREEGKAFVGVIFHGEVDESARLTNKDPEWAEVVRRAPIFNHSIEQEFTVRPGAKVRIRQAEVAVITADQEDYFDVPLSMEVTANERAVARWAPPAPTTGVVPDNWRAKPPTNVRKPRSVNLDKMAEGDIRSLPDDDERLVRRTLKGIERGKVPLERKERFPLQDCFSAEVMGDPSLRVLMYFHTDETWHVFYVGYHDYREAERRMGLFRPTKAASISYEQVDREGYYPGRKELHVHVDGEWVGWIAWDDNGEIADIAIDDKHQRKGLATALFRKALEIEPRLHHSDNLTPDGKAWIKSLGAKATYYRLQPNHAPWEEAPTSQEFFTNPVWNVNEKRGPVYKGYSCFDNPWHLWDYIMRRRLHYDRAQVAAFTGRRSSQRGTDDEPLVTPDGQPQWKKDWEAFEDWLLTQPMGAMPTYKGAHPSQYDDWGNPKAYFDRILQAYDLPNWEKRNDTVIVRLYQTDKIGDRPTYWVLERKSTRKIEKGGIETKEEALAYAKAHGFTVVEGRYASMAPIAARTMYHITRNDKVSTILSEGLRPDAEGWDAQYVWMFADLGMARAALNHGQWHQGRGVLLAIDVVGLDLINDPHPGWGDIRDNYAIAYEGTIPPERIRVVLNDGRTAAREWPERLWHLSASGDWLEFSEQRNGGVVHLTDDRGLRFWLAGQRLDYGGKRKYAHEVEVTDAVKSSSAPHEWLTDHQHCRIVRTLPVEEALAETKRKKAALTKTYSEPGQEGNRTHITYEESGTVPIWMVANLLGRNGETPGAHRNKHGEEWEEFKRDIAGGMRNPLFIMIDWDERGLPKIAEGNHRRDAMVENGAEEIEVTVRYFGHAERQGTFEERMKRLTGRAAKTAYMVEGLEAGWITTDGFLIPVEEHNDIDGGTLDALQRGYVRVILGEGTLVYEHWDPLNPAQRRSLAKLTREYDVQEIVSEYRSKYNGVEFKTPADAEGWVLTKAAARTKDGDEIEFTDPEHIEDQAYSMSKINALVHGQIVGFIAWYEESQYIAMIRVNAPWRRKGIATALLAEARKHDPGIRHSTSLSDDGRAWSQTVAAKDDWKSIKNLTFEQADERRIVVRQGGGDYVGYIAWNYDGEIRGVDVIPAFQRKGIATELLRRAREIDPNVHHSTALTDDGKAWSQTTAKAMDQYVMYRGILLGNAEEDPAIPEYNRKIMTTDPNDRDRILQRIQRGMRKSFGGGTGLMGGEWTHSERLAIDFALGEANTSYHWFMHHPRVPQVGVVLEAYVDHRINTDDDHPWRGLGEGIVYPPDAANIAKIVVQVWTLEAGEGSRGRKHLYDFVMPRAHYSKIAMPTSWRPYANDVFWDDYDVVITSEGKNAYEVYVHGQQIAARNALADAKAVIEERYGEVTWGIKRLPQVEVDHYYFGPTTEFTAPKQIWIASLPKATAKRRDHAQVA